MGVLLKINSRGSDLVWTSTLLAILRLSLSGCIRNFPCDRTIFSWRKFHLKLYMYFNKNLHLMHAFSKVRGGENKPQIENPLEFWSQWGLGYFQRIWTCSMWFLLLYFEQLILLLTQLVVNLNSHREMGKKNPQNYNKSKPPQTTNAWLTDNISESGDFKGVTHELQHSCAGELCCPSHL